MCGCVGVCGGVLVCVRVWVCVCVCVVLFSSAVEYLERHSTALLFCFVF